MKRILLVIACFWAVAANGQDWQKTQDSLALIRKEAYRKSDSMLDAKSAQNDKANAADEKRLVKKYGKSAYSKAVAGHVWLGMTDELCERALGGADNIQYTNTANGTYQTWTYYNTSGSVTVKNHKVIAITIDN